MNSWYRGRSSISNPSKRARKRLALETLEDRRMLAVFWVSPIGDDGGAGTSSDPFATIQRAVDEADESVTPGADRINVRPGTYIESVDIDDADPLHIKGSGIVTVDGDGDGSVFNILASHVTLQNLNITGGGATIDEFGDGISFDASSFGVAPGTALILDNVHSFGNDPFTGPDNGWGVFAGGVETVEIKNSTFEDNTVGIGIFGAETLDVSRTTSNENRDTGILTGAIDTQTFLRVEANSNGLGLAPVGGEGFDLTGESIEMDFVTANDNLRNGVLATDSGEIVVNRGTFNDNGIDGIGMIDVEVMLLNAINAHGNDIDGIFSAGFSDFLRLSSVKANDNGDNGVDASDLDGVELTGSSFDRNGDDGVNLDAIFDAVLDGISATGNGDDGIDVDDSFAVDIRNSRSNDNDDDGFDFDDTLLAFLENGVARGNDAGVSASGPGGLEIQDSDFIGNRAGIQAIGLLSLTLDNVVAKDNVEDGALIEGDASMSIFTEVEIIRGNYSGNGLDGVNIFEAGDVLVSGALLIGNDDDGLDISASGIVTLDNVTARLNGDEDIIIT